ncbi:MAG: MATE family efflux transporter, partial [Polyangiaceae bacterium]|nr:MATE family efflux transporter [Polyangiaceae bacterium]
ALGGNLLATPILRALGASGETLALAAAYLRPLFAGSVFYYVLILHGAALRAVGNTSIPLVIGLGWNALNVCFNYALIYGELGAPRLGVVGAAVSTVVAQAIGAFALLLSIARGAVHGATLELRIRGLDRGLARELVRLGLPASLDMMVLNAAFLSLVYLLGLVDGTAVAAHGVGLRVQNLAFVPALALAQAAGALVGNALGAGRAHDGRAVARAAAGFAACATSTLGLALVLFAAPLAEQAFAIESGSSLHGYSVTWMRVLGVGMPLAGVHLALIGTLRGAGATMTSLKINVVGTCFVQLPMSVLLGFILGLGPLGIWASVPISYVGKLFLSFLAYRRGAWAQLGLESPAAARRELAATMRSR